MTEARNAPSDHTPPDLWGRLALLDRSCHLVIENIYTPDKAGPRWSVTVKPRTGADEPFQFKGDRLVEVLHRAVEQAEARGWHS
jgi:hypothetical protein